MKIRTTDVNGRIVIIEVELMDGVEGVEGMEGVADGTGRALGVTDINWDSIDYSTITEEQIKNIIKVEIDY